MQVQVAAYNSVLRCGRKRNKSLDVRKKNLTLLSVTRIMLIIRKGNVIECTKPFLWFFMFRHYLNL